jgi:uncharacterized protein YecA (UPF0149 family)
MDTRTGRLYENYADAPEEARPFLREVEADELTPKQKRLMKIGRNDPCPCGSGAKFKKCCKMPIARGDRPPFEGRRSD